MQRLWPSTRLPTFAQTVRPALDALRSGRQALRCGLPACSSGLPQPGRHPCMSFGGSMGFLAFSSAAGTSQKVFWEVGAVLLAHSGPVPTLCFNRSPMSAARWSNWHRHWRMHRRALQLQHDVIKLCTRCSSPNLFLVLQGPGLPLGQAPAVCSQMSISSRPQLPAPSRCIVSASLCLCWAKPDQCSSLRLNNMPFSGFCTNQAAHTYCAPWP